MGLFDIIVPYFYKGIKMFTLDDFNEQTDTFILYDSFVHRVRKFEYKTFFGRKYTKEFHYVYLVRGNILEPVVEAVSLKEYLMVLRGLRYGYLCTEDWKRHQYEDKYGV